MNHTRVRLGNSVIDGTPKTRAGTGRQVHLAAETVEVLRGLKKQQATQRLAFGPAYNVTELVFVQEDGSPWKPSSVTQAFKRKAKALGLPPCRLHDLRHLSASLGHAAGESMLAISKRLGHSTPEFTASVYTHLFEEEQVADASRRAALLRPHPGADPGGDTSERLRPSL